MAWALIFDETKETIGNLSAFYDSVLIYQNSVNIADDASVADFIATAKKHRETPPDAGINERINDLLAAITNEINNKMINKEMDI